MPTYSKRSLSVLATVEQPLAEVFQIAIRDVELVY
jgi:hypothetical protein